MKSKQQSQPQTAAQNTYTPVQPTQFQPEQALGVGWNPVPQTFVPEAKPTWMQAGGWWDMPTWGMDAVTGEPLTQEQVQAQQYVPPEPEPEPEAAPQQQQAPFNMRDQYQVFRNQMDWENRRRDMMMQEGLGGSNGAMMGMFNPAFSPMSNYERMQRMQSSPQAAADWFGKFQAARG